MVPFSTVPRFLPGGRFGLAGRLGDVIQSSFAPKKHHPLLGHGSQLIRREEADAACPSQHTTGSCWLGGGLSLEPPCLHVVSGV
ncbi:hypothetical protein QC763_0018670 [Podospora pseudopauciseta]|uniref:Uncharacterized protein n=1 Tax=Podospora pseudopauciseta TaxID=2093780 RepID=A0ABR0I0Y4_9PEZI|nr:hypothetical protein QC763_0018670 [Podospora pseudopauciseta]